MSVIFLYTIVFFFLSEVLYKYDSLYLKEKGLQERGL